MKTGLLVVVIGALTLSGCAAPTADEHLQRARDYYAAGALAEAIIECKNALQRDAGLAPARFLLGRSQHDVGDYPAALVQLERALDLGHPEADVLPFLLLSKVKLGRYSEVLGELSEMATLDAAMMAIRGYAQMLTGDLDAAKSDFEAALALDPNSVHAHIGLGTLAWGASAQTASGYFRRATELAPSNREAWMAKANFESAAGSADDALQAYQTVLSLPGNDVLARLGIASVYLKIENYEAVLTETEIVLGRSADFAPALYIQAVALYQTGQLDAAGLAAQRVLASIPNHAPSLYLFGIVKYRGEQYAQAEDSLMRFISIDGGNASARKLVSIMRLARDDASGAIDVLEPVAEGALDPQLLALLGNAYLVTGDLESATRYLADAVDAAPEDPLLMNRLAIGLLASGDRDRATSVLESAIELDDELFRNDSLLVALRLREGEFDAAEALAQRVVERAPDNPMGDHLLGLVRLVRGSIDGAGEAFEAAVAKDPTFTPSVVQLARIDVAKDDVALATKRLEDELALEPSDTAASLELARIWLAEGRSDNARDVLEKAVAEAPDAAGPLLILAQIHYAAGDVEQAVAKTRQAVAIAPENVVVLAAHGRLLVESEQVNEAREMLDRAYAAVEDKQIAPKFAAELGELLMRVRRSEHARALFNVALLRDPNHALALGNLVLLDIRADKLTDAQKNFAKLSELGAGQAAIALVEGELRAAEGDLERAVELFEIARQAGSRSGVLNLAAAQARLGRAQEARQTLESWVAAHPDDVNVKLVLATLYLESGESEAALSSYEKLYERLPRNAVLLNNLAWLYMERGNPKALELAASANELAPENADIADTYGWILLQNGRAAEAVGHLERSTRRNPDNASAQYHLARAYAAVGNRVGARRAVQTALAAGAFPERDEAAALAEEITDI